MIGVVKRLLERRSRRRAEQIAALFAGPFHDRARAIGEPLGEGVARERAAGGGRMVPPFLRRQMPPAGPRAPSRPSGEAGRPSEAPAAVTTRGKVGAPVLARPEPFADVQRVADLNGGGAGVWR